MALDESKNEEDVLEEIKGIKVVYVKQLKPHLDEAVIDYADKWYQKGFRIIDAYSGSC